MSLFLPALATAATAGGSHSAKPNILFIAIDDLNDWVGVMKGHPQARTPNIDRLARGGTLFTNAHCQAPVCGASRASLLMGMLPSTNGIYLLIDDLDLKKSNAAAARAVFLQDHLKNNGYGTYGVGKIFHNGDKAGVHDDFGGHASFGPYSPTRFKYDPTWFGRPAITSTDWGAYPERDDLMPDFHVTEYAIAQLGRKHDKPFFLAAGFNRPHTPWYVPQKWFDLFPLESIITPPFLPSDMDDIPAMGRRVNAVNATPTTDWAIETGEWKAIVQAYLACIAFVDHHVGRVLDALEKSPYRDNTLVILWSDHGYHIGEKNRFAKQSLWERSTKVPLIFSGPGIPANQECSKPVNLLDIYSTIVDYCGLDRPEPLEGRSLRPLIENPSREWPHAAISFWGERNVAVFSEHHHYIVYEDGSEEFYDLREDPNEWKNLAGEAKYKPLMAEHRRHVPITSAPMSRYNKLGWNDYWIEKEKAAREAP